MRGIAVRPRQAGSLHLAELAEPALDDAPDGRGVVLRVLRVGVCGTDREIVAGEYGEAPAGADFLVLGHENLARVEAVGPNVHELAPGDHVMAMVRRPGASIYDRIGAPDMSTDDVYWEHGISRLHGFMKEHHLDTPEYLVRVPPLLADVGVLLEPTSIVEKGMDQIRQIQRRLQVWRPRRAAVLGAGSVGLLATLLLRLEGVEVLTMALPEPPTLNSQLVEALGASYLSVRTRSLSEAARIHGPFDVIFEATGYSPLAFEAMEVLAKNGILVLYSVTGGGREVTVPADAINQGFVLGNKVMLGTVNAGRRHVELAVKHLAHAELQYPGWLGRLVTERLDAFAAYERAFGPAAEQDIKRVLEIPGRA